MKTSDDFVGHSPVTRDIPDYEADPARILESLESKLISHYHFNLQGKPDMSDSLKTALQQAGVVHTRHNFFDLVEFLDTKLDHEQFRSQVTNSMAWFVDTLAINAARALFYRDWSDFKAAGSVGSQDEYNTFLENFLSSAELATNPGVEIVDGLSRDLVQLLGFSPMMHDIASRAASAAGRDYNPRTFDELLAAEKPMAVNAMTQAKLAQIAKFVEEDDEQAERETLKMLVSKTELNALDMHTARQKLNPVVLGLVGVAEKHAKETKFYDLDSKLQARLIQQGLNAMQSAVTRLASYNTIEVIGFAMILKNLRLATGELKAVQVTMRDAEEAAVLNAQMAASVKAGLKKNAKDGDVQAQEELDALAERATNSELGSKPNVGLPQAN